MRRCRALLALVGLLTLAGCERVGDPARRTLPRERFIEVNVALRQVEPEAPEADSARAAVLSEHGVTAEQLLAFVQARSGRPQELAQIWAEIQERLDSLTVADTVPEEEAEEVDTLPEPEGGAQLPPPVPLRPAGAT